MASINAGLVDSSVSSISDGFCRCSQFDKADPADSQNVPNEQSEKNHYLRHGPIQPNLKDFPKSNGRAFRSNWYV
jgi:hypothetical protein